MKVRSFVEYLLAIFLILGMVSWKTSTPKIFLVGDSISIYYGPYLKTFLEGQVELEQKAIETLQGRTFSRNGGDSRRVLDYLKAKLIQPGFHPDYLLLNCGLHDIGRDTIRHDLQVPLDTYRKNLDSIFSLIQAKKIKIIWVTTTPVVDSIHNSRSKVKQRYSKDLEEYNQAAAVVCKRYHVRVIDLHDFTRTLGPDAYLDNVHYKEEIRPQQAAYIAGSLRIILDENASK